MRNDVNGQFAKDQLVTFLRRVMRQVEALDYADLERLLAGEFDIKVRDVKAQKASAKSACSDEEMKQLTHTLQGINTREEARRLIDDALRTKAELLRLARMLDIPAPRGASAEDLRARLVEATVGYRIRSAVVRGDRKQAPYTQGAV